MPMPPPPETHTQEESPAAAAPSDASGTAKATRPRGPANWTALQPLRYPVFRMLWTTWFAANICMWMNDVAAAWMMTTLTTKPILVALVQTASTLPVFLLGLPSGALADIVDRKRLLMITQVWMAVTAVLLCLTIATGWLSAPLLLLLTFANGIGLAMRWPVFSAIVPELVPREHMPQALALNGVSMNASRIIGPLVAGALLASAGPVWVFVINALLSVVAGVIVLRWQREHKPSPLGREPFFSAMRVGLQFVGQSDRMKAVLMRVSMFFLQSTAVLALLPLVARDLDAGGAGTYTVLLASMGAGAIAVAMLLPRLRRAMSRDALVLRATLVQAGSTAVMAVAPNLWVAVPAMLVGGAAWLTAANSLSVSAQLALPDWVRARGMSTYQMAIMGASAVGAAVWGQVATWTNVHYSLGVASVVGSLAMMAAMHVFKDHELEEDLSPSRAFKVPQASVDRDAGHVVVTIDYRIDPARAAEFEAVMQESRRSRLRQGALQWHLHRDIGEPGHYVEQITDESWTEHLRRFDRVTASDVALRDRKLAFHVGESPPVVTRFVVGR
jgi:MFS family permease/quinol monooxygenase YgiN